MNTPTLLTGPAPPDTASIQAVFESILALMGTDWSSSSTTINTAGGGSTGTMNVSDTYGNGYTITSRLAGPKITIVPATATLGAGQTQQFSATMTDNLGVDVTPSAVFVWSMSGASAGTISATGLYTAPATISLNGFDAITCTDSNTGAATSVSISLTATAH